MTAKINSKANEILFYLSFENLTQQDQINVLALAKKKLNVAIKKGTELKPKFQKEKKINFKNLKKSDILENKDTKDVYVVSEVLAPMQVYLLLNEDGNSVIWSNDAIKERLKLKT